MSLSAALAAAVAAIKARATAVLEQCRKVVDLGLSLAAWGLEQCRFAWRLAGRGLELGWLFLPVLACLPVACLADGIQGCLRGDTSARAAADHAAGGPKAASTKGPKATTWLDGWWDLLLRKSQRSGPVFVKLGQWAATRRDLLPEAWCDQLGKLHDDTEAHPLAFTHKVLAEAFPKNRPEGAWHKKLLIEPKPVGSGCIAQVYLGYLILDDEPGTAKAKDKASASSSAVAPRCMLGLRALCRPCLPSGSYAEVASSKLQRCIKVAVKVVHPQVRRAVDIDLKVLRLAAWASERAGLDHLGCSLMLRQFADFLEAQTDLRLEAKNLRTFRQLLGPSSAVDGPVIIPEVFERWVASDALVMSFEEGEPIHELLTAGPTELAKEQMAAWKILVDLFWAMVFQHRFVHGDMHPGNLFWRRGKGGSVQIVVLDCGLVIDLTGQPGEDLSMMVKAFLTRPEEEVAGMLIQLSERVGGRAEDVVDPSGFITGIANLIREGKTVKYQLSKLNAGALMGRSMLLGRRHRVRFDARFVNLMVAMVVLQGVAMRLCGDGDIVVRMMPYVLGAAVTNLKATIGGGSRGRKAPEPEEEPSYER